MSVRFRASRSPLLLGSLALSDGHAQQFVDTQPPPSGVYFAPADLDGDGFPDLVSSEPGNPRVRIHHNDGHGRFAAGVTIANLSAPYRCGTFADFDGDSDLDMVLFANVGFFPSLLPTLHLLRNGGTAFTTTGVFQPPPASPTAWSHPWFVQAVDMDNDGDQDVVCAVVGSGFSSARYHVLANNGTGQFTEVTATWLPAPPLQGAAHVTPSDVDGDGRTDLLLDLLGIRVLRNTGASFVDQTALRMPALAASARYCAAGDIDGDGDADLIAVPETVPPMLLLNSGGIFADVTATQLASLPPMAQPAFFDADGDGDLDLYLLGQSYMLTTQSVLLRNDGAGNFLSATPAPAFGPELLGVPGINPPRAAIVTTDLELDGDQDLVLTDWRIGVLRSDGAGGLVDHWAAARLPWATTVALDHEPDGDVDVLAPDHFLENDGFGGFVRRQYVGPAPSMPWEPVVGDFDSDGDFDFASDPTIFFNAGGGSFTATPAGPFVRAIAAADFDADGDIDLLTIQSTAGTLTIFQNNGTGAFTAGAVLPVSLATVAHFVSADVADAEGDGDLDIVVSVLFYGQHVLRNLGGGTFVLGASSLVAGAANWADLIGNGQPDLVVSGSGPTRVLRLQGGALIDISATVLPPGVANSPLRVGDVDADGDVDLCGNQQFLRNNGTGLLAAEPVELAQPAIPRLLDVDGDGDLDLLTGPLAGSPSPCVCWNREHQVHLPLPAHTGMPLRIDVSSLPGRATPLEFAILAVALTRFTPGIPTPFGALRIGPIGLTLATPITPVAGLAQLDLPIPSNPAIVGVDLHFQALHISPGGWQLGNVASTRIE